MDLKDSPRINGQPDSPHGSSDWMDAWIKTQKEYREKNWQNYVSQLSEARTEGIALRITESIMDDIKKVIMVAVHRALEKGKLEKRFYLRKMEEDKDAEIAIKNAENKRLRTQLAELQAKAEG